jgi:hypothetical protein
MASNVLETLDLASSSSLDSYNPGHIVQAVNDLIPLGKEGALASIAGYYESADRQADPRQGLFWVLRVLFDVPAEPGYLPPVRLGAPRPAAPDDLRTIPRFPIMLIEDIPLLMVTSYILGGLPEAVDSHLELFENSGLVRTELLEPAIDIDNDNDLDRIVASFAARYEAAYETRPHDIQLQTIRSQLKRMGQ